MSNELFGYLWKDGQMREFVIPDEPSTYDRSTIVGAYIWTIHGDATTMRGLITEDGFNPLSAEEMPPEFRMHLLLLGVS